LSSIEVNGNKETAQLEENTNKLYMLYFALKIRLKEL
jgi:hypothetical protein